VDTRCGKPDGRGFGANTVGLRDGRFAPSVSSYLPRQRLSTLPIYTASGKVAGVFDQVERVFRKRCRNEHILHSPPAIAIDESVLLRLHQLGCERVEVELVESGRTLSAPFSAFENGIRLNRGHGEQIALPLGRWRVEEPEQPTLFEVA
jgi:hypothetical protein